MSLEVKLAKIRSPNLESQKHTAVVLSSIEDTLREQNTKTTPTAYFAALIALIRQFTTDAKAEHKNELVVSTFYLLDLVTSYVPPPLLRAQFSNILSVLAPIFSQGEVTAPLLKSSIGCLESLLLAQDSGAWSLPQSQTGPTQTVPALLSLAVDSRPKIRRRAHEALTRILQHPPPGPALDHPTAELAAVSALNNLKTAVDSVNQARKQRGRPDESHDPSIIHALQLVKTVATASGGWPSKNIEQLCELLLSISRSRNEYLVMSTFEVFEVIFESMKDEVSSSKLPRLLEAITELRPAQNDSQLLPPWIAILSRGWGVAAEIKPEDTFAKVPELFDIISGFLTSPSHNIRVSASECLISFFANCIPDSVILEPSVYDEKVLEKIANRANDLLSVRYRNARMEVFNTLSSLFDALRWRGDPYLLAIIKAVGELRDNDGFQGKKEADEVLGHAIHNVGPQAFLAVLPHNLINPRAGQPGRAWLLPLFRDHVSNTNLAHFKSEFVPLSEAMYQRIIDHGSSEKTIETKIFETVVQQVWAILPGYCDLPLDHQLAVDQQFLELTSNLLYKQTELRVDVCRGLQNLVESNQAILASDLPDSVILLERRATRDTAEQNIVHLAKFAKELLAVLFNVYMATLPQSRAYILQCVNAYLSITPENDLVETFERVSKNLESEMPKADQPAPNKQKLSKDKPPPTSHTLLDFVIALSIYLPRQVFGQLFSLALSILTNPHVIKSDPQLVKKAYKLIPRLATSSKGANALAERTSDLQSLILTTSDTTPVPARRDRLLAIGTLISALPNTDLHFIPSIFSEVVLACKDTNEKARSTGFDLLIAMTNKIVDPSNPAGTMIRNSKSPHMSDNAPDAPATMEEAFVMVSAGLGGVAPHMIAASVTALGRMLFEYHDDDRLPRKTIEELLDVVCMFLKSNNREIVRSVLGFVKVMVVVLDVQILEEKGRMKEAVRAMMVWSHENKGRMRVKVKGILDRCIRKFGGFLVEGWVDAEGEKKMIVNIRKTKERNKRKGRNGEDSDEDDESKAQSKVFDNEFDEAIYGSDDDDSEILGEGSDDDHQTISGVSFKGKKVKQNSREKQQYIRADDGDDDEPLDLLNPNSMARISSRKLGNSKATKKTKAKINEDGKLVFGRDDGEDVFMTSDVTDENNGAINAYVDAVDGPDAVRRGQKGRLKVKSGHQKSSRNETENATRTPVAVKMDLDVDEAREVARNIMRGSASPRDGRKKPQQTRRGMGIEKSRNGPRGRDKSRSGDRRTGKNVKFAGRR